MPDDQKKLGETLALLRQQLTTADKSGELPAPVVVRLQAALGELEDALQENPNDTSAASSPSDYLTESLAHFEQSHPTLAGTLQQLIDLLAQMGI